MWAFEDIHPVFAGEERKNFLAGCCVEMGERVRVDGAVGGVGVVVAAAEGERIRKALGPAGEFDGLRKEAFIAETIEQVTSDGGEVGRERFREVEPIAAAVEVGEKEDFHGWRIFCVWCGTE